MTNQYLQEVNYEGGSSEGAVERDTCRASVAIVVVVDNAGVEEADASVMAAYVAEVEGSASFHILVCILGGVWKQMMPHFRV